MLAFNQIGNLGRLGNQMFEYAQLEESQQNMNMIGVFLHSIELGLKIIAFIIALSWILLKKRI